MSKAIYINLPVKNITAAKVFYEALGFGFNKDFSNNDASVMIVDKNITLMLVSESFFKHNAERDIADTSKVNEVNLSIQLADRKEVDAMYEAGIKAGGEKAGESFEDPEIGMYSRGVRDIDGHKLDFFCMGA